jgi:hypothetical protein
MELLFEFEGHDGFDGIMLGHHGFPYHFDSLRNRGTASAALQQRTT